MVYGTFAVPFSNIPDSAGLEVGRRSGENSSRKGLTGLTAVHHTLGDRRKGSEREPQGLATGFAITTDIGWRTRCRGQWWHRSQAGDGS